MLGRGRASGLLPPSDEAFALSLLFSRIDAPFVAVPDPQTGNGSQDLLNKAFPLLFRQGAPGYRLIYENANWRLFKRNSDMDHNDAELNPPKSYGRRRIDPVSQTT